jgi:hypothetical protein
VSQPLASSVEFVGKAVRLLRSPAGKEEGQVRGKQAGQARPPAATSLAAAAGTLHPSAW